MELIKTHLKSSRAIGILSLIIFFSVAAALIFSTYAMNRFIKEEEEAQLLKDEFRIQGEALADGSDTLTAEVRMFAVTGDVKHFYNYWYEIYENRKRERAMETLKNSDIPSEEKILLEKAKDDSDLLVETETMSMKLMLLSLGISSIDDWNNQVTALKMPGIFQSSENMERMKLYLRRTLIYRLPETYRLLDSSQMREQALTLLYDENYERKKAVILSGIDQFQEQMNTRLTGEVTMRQSNTQSATVMQVFLAGICLAAIGFLMKLINSLYIRPLKNYTMEIGNTDCFSPEDLYLDMAGVHLLEAKIVPYGAKELVQLAEAFNQLISMFYQELSERKKAEENMKKARNEAELANQAKSVFLAQMTHELRTPLNAVNGYTYLLEQSKMNEVQKEYVKRIRYSSHGLLELINQILDFSKIESGHLELETIAFDLPAVIQETVAVLEQPAREKGLSLKVKLDEMIPQILSGDPLRIRQILMNLVGNAIKFTETGGVIVSVKLLKRYGNSCKLEIHVKDTGIGIEKEAKEKIFQPFIQSDGSISRKYGGTGLGLPICSQIIQLISEGRHCLHVESEPGKGTDFYFRLELPVSTLEKAENAPVQEKPQIPECPGKRILLVDDNETNIQVETELLKLCGIDVISASGGAQALQILDNPGNKADLILMDICMPEMDGYETAKQIRLRNGFDTIPIFALTADAGSEARKKAKSAGMNGCLMKPLRHEKLFACLRKQFGTEWKELSGGEASEKKSSKKPESKLLFDPDACLQELGNNEKALYSILCSFIKNHEQDEEKMQEFLKAGEYEKAGRIIHQLKGICGSLYFTPLSECCAALQEELKRGEQRHFEEFQCLWKASMNLLKQEKDRLEKMEQAKRQKMDGNQKETELDEILEQLKNLCEDCDTEAISVLETHAQALEQRLGTQRWNQLQACSLQFDFEGIAACLSAIVPGNVCSN